MADDNSLRIAKLEANQSYHLGVYGDREREFRETGSRVYRLAADSALLTARKLQAEVDLLKRPRAAGGI